MQYTPLADRPLKLKARKPLQGPSAAARGGKGRASAEGATAAADGEGRGGDDDSAAEPETWHWVPQQALAVTMRAISQVGVTPPRG